MTFKDLQKLVQSQPGLGQSELLQRLRDKPFWYWDPKQHKQEDIKTKGDCGFNNINLLKIVLFIFVGRHYQITTLVVKVFTLK